MMRTEISALLIFGSLTTAATLANAQAPTQPTVVVTVQKIDADRSAWVAAGIDRIHSTGDYNRVALLAFINRAYEQNPTAEPNDVLHVLNASDAEFRHMMAMNQPGGLFKDQQDVINTAFVALGAVPEAGSMAPIAKEMATWGFRGVDATTAPDRQIIGQYMSLNSFNAAQAYEQDELEKAWNLAQTNPAARLAINLYMAPYVGASTDQDAKTIFQHNPQWANTAAVNAVQHEIGADGTVSTPADDLVQHLTAQSKQEFDQLLAAVNQNREKIKDINQQQASLLDYLKDSDRRATQLADAKRQEEKDAVALQGASAGVYLLSKFVSFGNQEAGAAIATAGNSAIQLLKATEEFRKAAALGGASGTWASLVLTENVVGVALNVMNLFGMGNSSPEAQILAELNDIKNQVSNLRTEMHDRFDRIDQALNVIYDTMNHNFQAVSFTLDNINNNVNSINARLASVQSDLYSVRTSLAQINNLLFLYFNDSARSEVLKNMDRCLQNGRTVGPRAPFADCESFFFLRGTQAAVSSSSSVGPPATSLSIADTAIADNLSDISTCRDHSCLGQIETKYNYLARVLTTNFPDAVPDPGQLANPVDWAIAAESYVRLLNENPNQVTSDQGLAALMEVGDRLKSFTHSLSETGATDVAPAGNAKLWSALIGSYNKKADALTAGLTAMEQDFAKSKGGPDLSGGLDQNATVSFALPTMSPCEGLPPVVPGGQPEGYRDARWRLFLRPEILDVVPSRFRLAQMLGIKTIDFCYKVGTSDVPPNLSNWQITLTAKYGDKKIFDRLVGTQNTMPRFVSGLHVADTQWYGPITSSPITNTKLEAPLRDVVATDKAIDQSTDGERKDALDAATADLRPKLTDLRKDLYTKLMLAVLPSGEVVTQQQVSDLRNEMLELEGAKLLITATASLAFPRALQTNDLLRTLLAGGLDGERLVGEREIIAIYQAAATGNDLSQNATAQVISRIHDRSRALEDCVNRILDEISVGNWRESTPLIETPLSKLDVMRRTIFPH